MNPKSKTPLTRKQAAKFLSISLSTLNTWTKQGIVQAYQLGGKVYYFKEELIACMRT